MTFEEWNKANNWDGLNAGGAWDAAMEEAARMAEDGEITTFEILAKRLRALKRPT